MKPDLQDLALDLYIECLRNRLTVEIEWIPRIMNKEADTISKVIDYDEWETTEFLFKELGRMWGPPHFPTHPHLTDLQITEMQSSKNSIQNSGALIMLLLMHFLKTG